MKISITEPCHENWEAMTPNQQGAFCGSCQKDVVDFSKMSIQGIKNFFSKPKGKVCGRFEETQLQELSFDDFFAKFTYWNFSKKFAVIFFMAFGFWIFSNNMAAQNSERMLKGEVAIEQPVKVEPAKHVESRMIKGKIKVDPVCKEPEEPKQVKKDPEIKIEKEEIHIRMGMVAYHPIEKKDPDVKTTEVIEEEVEVATEDVVDEKTKVDPVEVIAEIKETPPIDIDLEVQQIAIINTISEINIIEVVDETQLLTVPTETETVQPDEEQKTIAEEKGILVYPNPNNGNFVVEVGHKQILRMYDETGKQVLAQEVEGSTPIHTVSLRPGMYTITFSDRNSIISKKVLITH